MPQRKSMTSYAKRQREALKKTLKTEKGARDLAEKELRKMQKETKRLTKASNEALKKSLKTEEGARKVAMKELKKAVGSVERRASPPTTAKNVARALSSPSNAAKAARGVALGKVGSLAGGVGVGVGLGATFVKAGSDLNKMQTSKNYAVDGGIDARIARQKAKRPAASTGGTVTVSSSLRGKSKASSPKVSSAPSKVSPAPSRMSSSKVSSTPSKVSPTPSKVAPTKAQGAPVQEGSSRPPIKATSTNRGYENYQSVMRDVDGYKKGGVVKKMAMGGLVPDVVAQGIASVAKQVMSKSPQIKTSSDNHPEYKRKAAPGDSGRELVPQSIMDEIRKTRGN